MVSESEDDNNTISSENQAFDFTVKVIFVTHSTRNIIPETMEYMFGHLPPYSLSLSLSLSSALAITTTATMNGSVTVLALYFFFYL